MKKLALLTLAIFFSIVLSAQIQNVKSYSIANSNTQIGAILPAGTTIFNVEDSVNYRLLIPSVASYTLNTAGFVERIDNYAIELTETNADSLALHLDTLQAQRVDINLKAPLASPSFTGDVSISGDLDLTATNPQINGSDGYIAKYTAGNENYDYADGNINYDPNETRINLLTDATSGAYFGLMDSKIYAPSGVEMGDITVEENGNKIFIDPPNDEITITSAETIITGNLTAATYGAASVSDTELGYVDGVTSSIQSQLNGKQSTLTNPVTGTGTNGTIPKYSGSTTLTDSPITTSGNDISIGGKIDITGTGNSIIIGGDAGKSDDYTDNHNIAIGYYSGYGMNTQSENVLIGSYAAYCLESGVGRNTAIGCNAGMDISDGEYNTVLGYSSGGGLFTGADYGVVIGARAAAIAGTGTNEIVIGARANGNGSNTATLGDDNVTDVYMNENGTAIIHGNGSLLTNLPTPTLADVSATDTVTTKGITVNGRIGITGTANSVFIGDGAGENDDLSFNYNTFIGYNSGNANTTGHDNVAIGYSTLPVSTNGYENVAIGNSSLANSTTAGSNTAVGSTALKLTTSGGYNVAVGAGALYSNTAGSSNVAAGGAALYSNTTGIRNVAIGESAGRWYESIGLNNTSGDESVFIGGHTMANADGEENQIVIGWEAIGNGSNTATIGDDHVTDVYMGEMGQAITHSYQYRLLMLNSAPSSATATGTKGEIRFTASYIYLCTATNTWVRAPLATW